MKIFILKTGLFTQNSVLDQAITQVESEHQVTIFDATRPKLGESDWDNAVKELVNADRVISI